MSEKKRLRGRRRRFPKSEHMRKPILTLAALLLLGSAAFAETYRVNLTVPVTV